MLSDLKDNRVLQKIYFNRSEVEQLLVLSSAFSFLMLMIRMIATQGIVFLFLPWNLFLAFIPYYIVRWLDAKPGWAKNRMKFVLAFSVWLLFIPNSFYILTDLYHLELSKDSPRWFDLTLIFSFAWNGMLLGILSIRKMEILFKSFLGNKNILFFLYPVMVLIAFGIYVGRYLRFNSWDVFLNPFSLFGKVGEMFFDPAKYTYAWGMIFCFSVFLTLIYLMIKGISKSFYKDV